MSNKWVLVVITAKTCGACHNFLSVWPKLKAELQQTFPNLVIVEISQNTTTNVFPGAYPSALGSWCQWFPTLLLFKKSAWDTGVLSDGYIFSGTRERNVAVQLKRENGGVPLTPQNVTEWIRSKTR